MSTLNTTEVWFITSVVEGFFYGVYSGVFAMYLQYRSSSKDGEKKRSIVFCSICLLYVLSVSLFVADTTDPVYDLLNKPILPIYFMQSTLFGCCDFIAQFILIYRCWIVWGYNIRVVIIPSILAFAFLVIWLVALGPIHISSGYLITTTWANSLSLAALILSLAVNALVTGLIVFRIFKVFRGVTTDEKNLGAPSGSKLRRIIFIIIESGMTLFSIQLARVVATIVAIETNHQDIVISIIIAMHEVLTGITPTIILVRISMGLSFHDEKSMEEVAIGSLRFAGNHSNSVQETGSVSIIGQENRDDDIGVERSSNGTENVE